MIFILDRTAFQQTVGEFFDVQRVSGGSVEDEFADFGTDFASLQMACTSSALDWAVS